MTTSWPRLTLVASLVVVSLLVAHTLLAQGLTPAKPESVGMSSARLERLTSALQAYVDDDRLAGAAAIVARLAALPLDAHPGERWIYGYNTDILGAMIEEISGQTLGAFLRERLFDPLGMDDTHFFLPHGKADRLTTVYSATDHSGIKRAPDPGYMVGQGAYVDGPRTSFSGGAGALSTVEDYATFLQMMLNGGELDGVRILSPTTVDLMTVDHTGEIDFRGGQGFGLGFSIVEDPGASGLPGSVGEYGWGGAYHSTYWVDPHQELV